MPFGGTNTSEIWPVKNKSSRKLDRALNKASARISALLGRKTIQTFNVTYDTKAFVFIIVSIILCGSKQPKVVYHTFYASFDKSVWQLPPA